MTEYETIIKNLRACAAGSSQYACFKCPWVANREGCITAMVTAAANAIEELEEKAMAYAETLYAYEHPWIPVSSALPEDGSDILAVHSYCGEVRIVPANYDRGVWYDCVYNRVAEHITHWMPLPQTPTECRQMVTDSNQAEEGE